MEPRKLLRALMDRSGDNPNSLARKLHDAVGQPQIHKFLSGTAREPRRATLQPLASHYDIPLDAFYDPEVAGQVAAHLGLLGATPGTEEPTPAPGRKPVEQNIRWPFKSVSYRRFQALPADAWADIEQHLEILVEKWERAGQAKKRKPTRPAP